MSRSGIRRKHTADAIQLRRISCPASPTYKEGPSGRANGRATHNAYKKRYQGPHVSLPERRLGGAGRPPGSAEPGRPPVQVNFNMACPLLLLITFHICFWREPTLKTI